MYKTALCGELNVVFLSLLPLSDVTVSDQDLDLDSSREKRNKKGVWPHLV